MARLFVSHSSKNNPEALALRDWLIEEGWEDIFLDIDPQRGLVAGQRWQAALKAAADRCEAVLFIISPEWARSKWCLAEFLLAQTMNKQIFAVLVEPTPFEDLPKELTTEWQLVDLTTGLVKRAFHATVGSTTSTVSLSAEGLETLKKGLAAAGLDPRFFAWPPTMDPERAPYRGLKPLEAEDAGIFFGRDAQIVAAMDALRQLRGSNGPRIFVVLGASGAGKSSFMRAGLLPRLAREEQTFRPLAPVRPGRRVLTGDTGFVASIDRALRLAGHHTRRSELMQQVEASTPALIETLKPLLTPKTKPTETPVLVLPVDQSEELFASDGQKEAARFLELLAELLSQTDLPVLVLFTIRSDNYERLQSVRSLAGMPQRTFSLLPMPKGSYSEVITGPLRRLADTPRALSIDRALIEKLLSDVEQGGASDALPLLAFTLERLYIEVGGRGRLTHREYDALGRLRGSLEAAVERAFDAANSLPTIPRERKARLALLRRGLVPWLAGIDPDTGSPRRRVARLSEIPDEARPLIDLLVDQRLLSTDMSSETNEVTIEPSHEALLRQWGLLQGWLEEDFEDLTTLEGVKRAAREWSANDEDPAWLAHGGGRLIDAETVAGRIDFADHLVPAERAYLGACRAKEEDERARRKKEERWRRRSAWVIAWLSMTAALVAGGLGWLAYQKAEEAERQKTEAQKATTVAEKTSARLGRQLADLEWNLAAADLAKDEAPEASLHYLRAAVADSSRAMKADARMAAAFAAQAIAPLEVIMTSTIAGITGAEISMDETMLLTWGQRAAELWNLDGTRRAQLRHEFGDAVLGAKFLDEGRLVATWGEDSTIRLWRPDDGQPAVGPLYQQAQDVELSKDGTVLLGIGKEVALWDPKTGRRRARLRHKRDVTSALFNHDQTRVVTTSRDETARIWDARTGRPKSPKLLHDHVVSGAVVSNDDALLATWSLDKSVRLWRMKNGAAVGRALVHDDSVGGAVFSDDAKLLLSWSDGNEARLWRVKDGEPACPPMEHDRRVAGGRLYSGAWPRIVTWSRTTVYIWDPQTCKQTAEPIRHVYGVDGVIDSPDGHGRLSYDHRTARVSYFLGQMAADPFEQDTFIRGAAWSQDSHQIATWTAGGVLSLWDINKGRLAAAPMRHGASIVGAQFIDQSRRLVSWSEDRTIRVWNIEAFKHVRNQKSQHRGWVNGAKLSADGNRVLTWSSDGAARIWRVADLTPLIPEVKHDESIRGASFSPDESKIVTWSGDSTSRLWSAVTGRPQSEPLRHDVAVQGARFSPDGSRLFTWSEDGTVKIWTRDGEAVGSPLVFEVDVDAIEPVLSEVVFSPDGQRVLLVGHQQPVVHIRRITDGSTTSLAMNHAPDSAIVGAAWNPIGDRVLTWADDGTARLWDAATGRPSRFAIRHDDKIAGAMFSANGARVLTWSDDGTARQWSVKTSSAAHQPLGHSARLHGARYVDRGQAIVTWAANGRARLWRARDGQPITPPLPHGAYEAPVFSLPTRTLVTWEGSVIRLWRADGGQPKTPPILHSDVRGIELAPDGSKLVSWTSGLSARVWSMQNGQPVTSPLRQNKSIEGAAFVDKGRAVLTWARDGGIKRWALQDVPLRETRLRVEARSGITLQTNGERRLLSPAEWRDRRRSLAAIIAGDRWPRSSDEDALIRGPHEDALIRGPHEDALIRGPHEDALIRRR